MNGVVNRPWQRWLSSGGLTLIAMQTVKPALSVMRSVRQRPPSPQLLTWWRPRHLERNGSSSWRRTLSHDVRSRSAVGRVHLYLYRHSSSSRLDYRDTNRRRWRSDHLEHRSRRSLCFIPLAWPPMTAVLAVVYVSAISIIGAFLFTGVEWLEPNRRLAIVLKCAILAAGVAAIANQLLPGGLLVAIDMGR